MQDRNCKDPKKSLVSEEKIPAKAQTLPLDLRDKPLSSGPRIIQVGKDSQAAIELSLQLRPAVTVQDNIEFTQVFRLPLSKSVYEMYKRMYAQYHETREALRFDPNFLDHDRYMKERIGFIDLRPQRWYRDFDFLAQEIQLMHRKLGQLEEREIKELEKILDAYTVFEKNDKKKEEYDKFSGIHKALLERRSVIHARLTALLLQRKAVIREILANGYLCIRVDISLGETDASFFGDDKIRRCIIKKVKRTQAPPPIAVSAKDLYKLSRCAVYDEPSERLDQDKTWVALVEDLEKNLPKDLPTNTLAEFQAAKVRIASTGEFLKKQQQDTQQYGGKFTEDSEKAFLRKLRAKFVLRWNDPRNYREPTIEEVEIKRGDDPLRDFYERMQKRFVHDKPYLIHRFNLYPNAKLYDEDGVSLQEFMRLPNLEGHAIILPCFDEKGKLMPEQLQIVIGPRGPDMFSEVKLPVIKFVETLDLQLGWDRYVLGHLCGTFSLFPGEKEQLMVESQTRFTRKASQQRKQGEEVKRHLSSSFEENLRDELAATSSASAADDELRSIQQSSRDVRKDDAKHEEEKGDANASSSTSAWSASASTEAEYSYGGMFSASGSMGGSMSGSKTSSHADSHNTRSQQSFSKEAALMVSTKDQGQRMTKNSRETAGKNLQNKIDKIASDTSANNKVEVTTTSAEQYEEKSINQKIVRVENPNLGRTVNYNFFQLQNVYKTRICLKDVKIVVDTGIELVKGTKICRVNVYDLEEFNKIYSSTGDAPHAILCAWIAKRVLETYTGYCTKATLGQSVLKIRGDDGSTEFSQKKIVPLKDIYKRLVFSAPVAKASGSGSSSSTSVSSSSSSETKQSSEKGVSAREGCMVDNVELLNEHLRELKRRHFVFQEGIIITEKEHQVNVPATHVDAQLGFSPSTEPYYEARRAAELEALRADVDRGRAEAKLLEAGAEYAKTHPMPQLFGGYPSFFNRGLTHRTTGAPSQFRYSAAISTPLISNSSSSSARVDSGETVEIDSDISSSAPTTSKK